MRLAALETPKRRAHVSGIAVLMTAATAASLALTACGGPTRSVQSFCKTYNDEKSAFLTRYASLGTPISQDDPHAGTKVLTDVLMGVQSLGDVKVILTKLDHAAPKDIEPDTAAVLQSWTDMQGNLGDEAQNAFNPAGMAGAMVKGMFMAAESNGSWTRLGDYISKNCG